MKVLRILLLLTGISLLLGDEVNALALSTRLIVIVNKDAITAADVEERVRLINLRAGNKVTASILPKMRDQIIQGMIEEILQLQAAKPKKIKI